MGMMTDANDWQSQRPLPEAETISMQQLRLF